MSDEQRVEEPIVERSFYAKIAVVGPTGTGKSYLSKTADILTTGYINMERKPLPYLQDKQFEFMAMPKTWAVFKEALTDYGKTEGVNKKGQDMSQIKRIIIDSQTMAFNTLMNEMSTNFTGYDIFKQYNRQIYAYLDLMKNIEKDIIILAHDEWLKMEGEGKKRMMAVHGKEFEGKIEEHFSQVMYTGTRLKDGRPTYFLKTFEENTSTKVPEGMFRDPSKKDTIQNFIEVPNDAKFLFDAAEKYYSISKKED